MKLHIISDIHLEFQDLELPGGETLIIAGDMCEAASFGGNHDGKARHLATAIKRFLNEELAKYEDVVFVPGNHEYYYYDLATKCGVLNEKIRDNVFLVNNTAISRNNVRFIFSTLWSKISPVHQWQIERAISDFQVIKYNKGRFSCQHFNQQHDESMVFLKRELNIHPDAKSVVVTHHVPSFLHYPERYKNDPLNEAFTVELHDFIEEQSPDYWIYGHHHNNTPDFEIGKTVLLTNQLGYVKNNEHRIFSQNKKIHL